MKSQKQKSESAPPCPPVNGGGKDTTLQGWRSRVIILSSLCLVICGGLVVTGRLPVWSLAGFILPAVAIRMIGKRLRGGGEDADQQGK